MYKNRGNNMGREERHRRQVSCPRAKECSSDTSRHSTGTRPRHQANLARAYLAFSTPKSEGLQRMCRGNEPQHLWREGSRPSYLLKLLPNSRRASTSPILRGPWAKALRCLQPGQWSLPRRTRQGEESCQRCLSLFA